MKKAGKCAGIFVISMALLLTIFIIRPYSKVVHAAEYTVSRLSGTDRYRTGISISRAGWLSSEYVVLSTGQGDDKFADALAGAPLSYSMNAPILLTPTEALYDDIKNEIKRLKAKSVYILGGTSVVSDTILKGLENTGLTVKRIWGQDRYETAVQIGIELKKRKTFTKAIITTGEEFQYAMMMAPFAARNGWPVLFTEKALLNSYTEDAIKKWGIKDVEIIGNVDIVSRAVEDRLKTLGINVGRIEGTDINEININIINKYGKEVDNIAIARDDLFADALAGTPFAAVNNAQIILVGQTYIHNNILNFTQNLKFRNIFIFGGAGAVSEDVISAIKGEALLLGQRGSTPGNINNLGRVAIYDGFVYYSNSHDGGRIYKMKEDGSNKIKLNDDEESQNINVSSGWVYYSNPGDGYRLYRIKTDGSGRKRLNDDITYCTSVIGEWIFYVKSNGYGEGGPIIKIKTDGSGRAEINKGSSWNLNIDGDWIYFTNIEDGYKLYKIKADGSGMAKIGDDASWFAVTAGDWIYYSNATFDGDGSAYLCKIKKDGSGRSELNRDETYCINVSGDWIYYSNMNEGNKIFKVKKDGSEKKILNNNPSWYINIIGDSIYYLNYDDGGKMYRIKIDGSLNKIIDSAGDTPLSGGGNTLCNIANAGTWNTMVTDNEAYGINVAGDFIYYTTYPEGLTLYSIKIDGSGREKVE